MENEDSSLTPTENSQATSSQNGAGQAGADRDYLNQPPANGPGLPGDSQNQAEQENEQELPEEMGENPGDNQQLSHFLFTINNWTSADEERLLALRPNYLIIGRETAPHTGTLHLQGYMQLAQRIRFRTIRSRLQGRAYIVKPKGSPQQNVNYCKKGAQPKQEWRSTGVRGRNYGRNADISEYYAENFNPALGTSRESQGQRGAANFERYEHAWQAAKSGQIEEVDPDIRIRHYNVIKQIGNDYAGRPADRPQLKNYWIWGETGVGKSLGARRIFPDHYPKMKNKWWDGYRDEEAVIIDEWLPDDANYHAAQLNIWSDHFPFTAEYKGSSRVIRPDVIIITSNYRMSECFDPRFMRTIGRRFEEINAVGFDENCLQFITAEGRRGPSGRENPNVYRTPADDMREEWENYRRNRQEPEHYAHGQLMAMAGPVAEHNRQIRQATEDEEAEIDQLFAEEQKVQEAELRAAGIPEEEEEAAPFAFDLDLDDEEPPRLNQLFANEELDWEQIRRFQEQDEDEYWRENQDRLN